MEKIVNNWAEVIHRQSVHVSARKSIDIFRRVQLARARERAKDRKWIFRNVIFPAEGNEARVFLADFTREY